MTTHIIFIIIASILMLAGIASVFLFVFPSLPAMFIIALAFGFIDHFQHLRGTELIILGAIALLAEIIDFISGVWGAKIGGASRNSIIFGIIGLIAGLIIFPPFGGIIGLFLGVAISELVSFGSFYKALKAGGGGLLGSIVGMIIKLLLAIIFLVCFIIFAI